MMKKRKTLAPGALTAPLPPALVTVGTGDRYNVLTVAWTGILATKPPRTYVSIRPSRYSYGLLREGGEFVINLPTVNMAGQVDYAGIYTGAKVDKFRRCGFTATPSTHVAPPTVAECPLALECRVIEMREMGTHHVFFADIVGVSCHEELLDEGGRLCLERAGLLAYAHGQYYALGEVVGRFGFSTDKPKKSEEKSDKASPVENNKPFYSTAPRGTVKRRPVADKDKGRPHKKGGKPKK